MGQCFPCIQMIIVHRTHACNSSHQDPAGFSLAARPEEPPDRTQPRPSGRRRRPISRTSRGFVNGEANFCWPAAAGRIFLYRAGGAPCERSSCSRPGYPSSAVSSPNRWKSATGFATRRRGSSPPSADSPSTAKCASLEPLQAPPRFPPPATATSMQAATGGFPPAAGPNRRGRFLSTEEPPERGDPWHRTSR